MLPPELQFLLLSDNLLTGSIPQSLSLPQPLLLMVVANNSLSGEEQRDCSSVRTHLLPCASMLRCVALRFVVCCGEVAGSQGS